MKKLVFDGRKLKTMVHTCGSDLMYIAEAQAKFDEWYRENIESAPLVYGSIKDSNIVQLFGEIIGSKDTRTARLIMIQEIKKECKHEPSSRTRDFVHYCAHCDSAIEPIGWKEVKP